ncbi:AAA family ATPase [Streptomyces sp. NPDC001536]|uniref:AAA family ATPase n=1 Tax=Streptomyces sp. NPDC001536 TaxID=3364583 RepID=UPI0036C57735
MNETAMTDAPTGTAVREPECMPGCTGPRQPTAGGAHAACWVPAPPGPDGPAHGPGPAGPPLPAALVGRGAEQERVTGLAQALPHSGGALLLTGEPGIGKSTLLRQAAARCGGARVLWAAGVESEAVLPYAVLADVLLPLRGHFDALPPAQRRAVESCLALGEPAEPNPYAVCAGALGVLATAGAAEPLLVLVDDLQWADPSSRQVLQFVARRLATEPAALIMAARGGREDGPGEVGLGEVGLGECLPQVALGPLTDDECWTLLQRHALDRADPAAGRIVRLAQGNPLVLVEYAAALTRARTTGAEPWDDSWEAPGPLVERAWRGQLRTLPPRSREALVYVAAGRTLRWPLLQRAMAAEGLTTADLDPAEAAGLVRMRDDTCELRHPVLGPLVLRQCPTVRRPEVYRRLAEVSSGELRSWYLAAASPGPDESVAARLAADARQARQRGALAAAAPAWHRAAELSPDPADAARRLFEAAHDAFHGGTAREAAQWCEQALSYSRDPLLTADIELLRGQARTWLGDPGRAHQLLVAAARAVEPVDRARACRLYGAAVIPATMDGRIRDACDIAARCASPADDVPDAQRRHAAIMRARAGALGGEVRASRTELRALLQEGRGRTGPEELQATTEIAQGLSWTEEWHLARRTLDTLIEEIRRDNALSLLPYALLARCGAEMWSHWPTARADAAEALRWAEEFGHLAMTGYALVQLARLDALRGDFAACEEHVARYERSCGGRVQGLAVFARGALGTSALAAGDPEAARTHLEAAFTAADGMGLVNPSLMPWLADLAEACLRTGARDRAVAVADWLQESATRTGLAWPVAAHAHCRVLLARSAEEAADWLAVAERAAADPELAFEQARTRLVAGEVLRRFRRPSAAREPLLLAQRTFGALGAVPWADRAAAEVAASGHRTAAPAGEQPAVDLLTPQELQVARAIGEGLSNVEAAASLFLSRKTIEAHLTRVYRKLGVRSRSDLARRLAGAGITGSGPRSGSG